MYTLHIVSHTHWDREWYQTFQQFRLRLVHLVDGLLDILTSDPAYRSFMLDGQTIVLEDYLAMRPEREADLRRYIQEGRISIGPWHILPDEFLVSPEATLRNLLQGERTARGFGPKMMVGYIPDTFGHIGQMPQILGGFGIESACVQRGLGDEPCEFWWQAPDGSRVFMAYLRDGYSNAAELPGTASEAFVQGVRDRRDSLAPFAASPHLLLMLGTDHMEPPPNTSQAIAFAQGRLDGDTLVHSTLAEFIDALHSELDESRLSTIAGELRSSKRHPLLPNVLSSRMWIKQRNQACETLLEKWAEPFSTWSERMQGPLPPATIRQPEAILRQAWRLLMENHPHDSICGCSIDAVHAEMASRFDGVEQIGEKMLAQSLETITWGLNTLPPSSSRGEFNEIPIVVFNPSQEPRRDLVSATVELPPGSGEFELLDAQGASLPYQTSGLGNRELISMQVGSSEFRRLFAMVTDGRVAGLTVQEFESRREGSQVWIEIYLSEKNEPNRPAWERGSQQMADYLADPAITSYAVRGHSLALTNLTFISPPVPGHGYTTLWVRCQAAVKKPPVQLNPLAQALLPLGARLAQIPFVQSLALTLRRDPAKQPPHRIQNEYYRIDVERDGSLTLTDLRTKAVYPGLNRFVDGSDCGDEYNYAPPLRDRLLTARLKSVRHEIGPVSQSLSLKLEVRLPLEIGPDRKQRAGRRVTLAITSRVSLSAGVERLDIHTTVDNPARDHRLRVHFPVPFKVSEAWHDGHFEVVRRPVGTPAFESTWVEQPRPEVPQRNFTELNDGSRGLLLANRGLPEVEVLQREKGSEIALTLLRCVGWLSRDDFSTRRGHAGPPSLATPGAQMPGSWSFDYAVILPHAEQGWAGQLAAWQGAAAFAAPLRAVSAGLHTGSLSPSAAFLEVTPAQFAVSAVKTAEDGRGWLVRGYNLGDEPITVQLKPWRSFARASLVNLAEQEQEALTIAEDGSVSLPVRGHEIASVMFCE